MIEKIVFDYLKDKFNVHDIYQVLLYESLA